jgi:hypothetical protein
MVAVVREGLCRSQVHLRPALVYCLTDEVKHAFDRGHLEAGEAAYFTRERSALARLAYEDESLQSVDIDCLEDLTARLPGMRVTFAKGYPAASRQLFIEEFRSHGCVVETGAHPTEGFLAVLDRYFRVDQLGWWLSLAARHSPYQTVDGGVALLDVDICQVSQPGREDSFWYAGEVARCRGYHP